ncbi:MAG TPA: hypothetical protein VMU43_07860 [Candidatus Acidoferrum sp.]|nr:hypothetical protein [Candidatus Acidoferrum sp.]
MPRLCIALDLSRTQPKMWSPCSRRAAPDDVFCVRHRDGLIGAILGLYHVYREKHSIGHSRLLRLFRARRAGRSGWAGSIEELCPCCGQKIPVEESAELGGQIPDEGQAGQGSCPGDLASAAQHDAARASDAG